MNVETFYQDTVRGVVSSSPSSSTKSAAASNEESCQTHPALQRTAKGLFRPCQDVGRSAGASVKWTPKVGLRNW